MNNQKSPLSSLEEVLQNAKQKTQRVAPLIASAAALTAATDGYAVVTVSALSNVAISTSSVTNIDINGDANNDFSFDPTSGINGFFLGGIDGYDQLVENTSLYPDQLSIGSLINAGQTFSQSTVLYANGSPTSGLGGQSGNFYLGFKFDIGSFQKYGYMVVNKPNTGNFTGFTLVSAKYESDTATAITVPEPSETAAVLALGASAVIALRHSLHKAKNS